MKAQKHETWLWRAGITSLLFALTKVEVDLRKKKRAIKMKARKT